MGASLMSIRVLLVDDQKIIRQGLQVLLEPEVDIEIVGTADSGLTAIQQVEALRPQVVLIDIVMPEIDGIAASRVIHNRFPTTKILVLSGHDDPAQLAAAMQAGAQGYLLKNTPAAELADAIRSVHRGYAQMGPGLVEKMMGAVEAEPAAVPEPAAVSSEVVGGAPAVSPAEVLPPEPTPLVKSNGKARHLVESDAAVAIASTPATSVAAPRTEAKKRPNRWWLYLFFAIVLNAGLWTIAWAVLRYKPITYVSQWALLIPASGTSTNVNIPGIGNASADSDSPFRNPSQDPRENYKFIAESDRVIDAAASRLGIAARDFGKPRISIIDNSSRMEFEMESETPAQARDRALALNAAFQERLAELRAEEIRDRQERVQDTLQASRFNLEEAQRRLADFRASADISSSDQLGDVSATIELLRQQQAERAAEQLESEARLRQLQSNLGLDAKRAAEAFTLKSDTLFQQLLANYSAVSAELVTLSAKFRGQSPLTNEKQLERDRAREALLARGQQILGRGISLAEIEQLSLGRRDDAARDQLFQQLIVVQAEAEGLKAQVSELGAQIEDFEARRRGLAQQAAVLEDLNRDVRINEAVFSSTLATVDLTQANASASYPEVLAINDPSLPQDSTAPDPLLVWTGTSLASALICLALFSLWLRSRAVPADVQLGRTAPYPPALPY
ncbi:MAG: response regulator [Cyanobacteria bacterium J06648_11]